ncbi:MAG: hypothetical protein PVS3B3_32110 [Ktedonobacteraceae bacterium]
MIHPENAASQDAITIAPPLSEKITIRIYALPHVKRVQRKSLKYDPWFRLTLLAACLSSITSLWYFFQNYEILLTGDTYAHMLIARRLFDNLTPGIAQLGGIWLPLPHLLMLPFIWNDYLWHTGLAGSFAAMPCYILSAVYLFLTAERLTHNSRASFIGTLAFIGNLNILYLQTTPLSELILIVTLILASYYFLVWAQEGKLKHLVAAGASTFLATLARYDAWVLFLVLLLFVFVIGKMQRTLWSEIESNLLAYATLGGLGIVLWILWCLVIFGDPLYFQHSAFSSQAQQQSLIDLHYLFTYHDLWQSIRTYIVDAAWNVGSILLFLGAVGCALFYSKRRLTPETVAASAFLIPFAFYVFSLYTGQAALFVPGASPVHVPSYSMTFYNTRYGVQMVAPTAIFIAILASIDTKVWLRHFLQIMLCLTIVVQMFSMASTGIISLQDGQYGLDCAPLHPIVVYIAQHYAGGKIMTDTFTSGTNAVGLDVGVNFKSVIYEGSGTLWKQALRNPALVVDWVVANPLDRRDLVTQSSHISEPVFLSQFTLVVQEQSGLSLYHRNGLAPLPTRPVPSGLLTEHRLCGLSGPIAHIQQFAIASSIVYTQNTSTLSTKRVKTL